MGMTLCCPHCRRPVGNTNRQGDAWLRVRAVVVKKSGNHEYVCPGCRQTFDEVAPTKPMGRGRFQPVIDNSKATLT